MQEEHPMLHSIFRPVLLVVFIAFTGAAGAAEQDATKSSGDSAGHPLLTSNWYVGLGAFYATASTNASYDSTTGVGTNVNFENMLGLDEHTSVVLASFRWRFAENWALSAEYFNLPRDGKQVLQQDITWGDTTYPAGSNVKSDFNVEDIRVMVDWSFFKRKDKEVGIGFGLHVMGLDGSISGTGFSEERADVLAPLPVLSVHGNFALTERWAVAMRVDWLSVNYQDYSGGLRATGVDVAYQPFRNVGFAFGYRSLALDVDVDSGDWIGTADVNFTGPSFQVYATF